MLQDPMKVDWTFYLLARKSGKEHESYSFMSLWCSYL